ncbi:FAD-dependent thymidylate synthase [Pseudomonas sp. RL]|uniref:FAD-dependent thymidylate synthase n=1 Tax=Pseudomonas sp. RL TaxID=1452718 RepID=UPI0009DFD858|nr:FAD-dependent thymidylate synthase [Pseudomonas sp. RL]
MEIETPDYLKPDLRLISYTVPVEDLATDGIETPIDLIAYCARVSNPANQRNRATAGKLIRYLVENAHWSPLEMVDVTFQVVTARDISRQAIRHRSFHVQEFSQRYAEVTEEQFCLRELRYQHPTNRQASVEPDLTHPKDAADAQWWELAQLEVLELMDRVYREALRRGFAKEVARVVLPEGLTLTRYYFKGTLRDWIHYLALRGGNGTQKEHMQVAFGAAKVISALFPLEIQ